MNINLKYISLIALAIILFSCNKEVLPESAEMQVKVSAKIAPSIVTRVTEDGTAFTDGDIIKVQNIDRESKNLATYTYSAYSKKWSTEDELYWDGSHDNTFNAWYPATADYATFDIPADQTSGIALADWMTATTTTKKANGTVGLLFNHHLSKVRIIVESWSNEYTSEQQVVNSLRLKSLSSTMSFDTTAVGDMTAKWIDSHASTPNATYVAIVAPGSYSADEEIMQLYVNGSTTPLIVKTSKAIDIESGKAYNFRLSIGSDLATIASSVVISDWEDVVLDDQEANATDSDSTSAEKIAYTLTQGYASEGTLNNNATHRVKTDFIYGNFSIKVNDGYVIRAIYTYPTAKVSTDFSCVLANSTDRTEMDVMNEGRYAIITFSSASDPNAAISSSANIVKSLTRYEVVLPETEGCPYINNAVFFGDSIMHGVYSYFEKDEKGVILRKNGFDSDSYSFFRIPDYFGLLAKASVTNSAKRGSGWITDTRNLGNALEMVNKTDFTKYDFAAFCIGINDWIQGADIGSLDAPGDTGGTISEGTVVANMIACFDKIRSENPECKIVVYSPYISWGQYSDGGDYKSNTLYGDASTNYALGTKNKAGYTLQQLIDVIDEVCHHYDIRHAPLSQSRVCRVDNVKDIMIDGLHPSREVRLELAAELLELSGY